MRDVAYNESNNYGHKTIVPKGKANIKTPVAVQKNPTQTNNDNEVESKKSTLSVAVVLAVVLAVVFAAAAFITAAIMTGIIAAPILVGLGLLVVSGISFLFFTGLALYSDDEAKPKEDENEPITVEYDRMKNIHKAFLELYKFAEEEIQPTNKDSDEEKKFFNTMGSQIKIDIEGYLDNLREQFIDNQYHPIHFNNYNEVKDTIKILHKCIERQIKKDEGQAKDELLQELIDANDPLENGYFPVMENYENLANSGYLLPSKRSPQFTNKVASMMKKFTEMKSFLKSSHF